MNIEWKRANYRYGLVSLDEKHLHLPNWTTKHLPFSVVAAVSHTAMKPQLWMPLNIAYNALSIL